MLIFRFLIYVIFSPITSRLGYGMSFRCLTLAVWGGTPSLINICIALLPCPYHKTGSEKECPAFFYVVGMVVISLILNISTLSSLSVFLKMETVSPTHGRELKLCSEYLKRISNRSIVFMKIEKLSLHCTFSMKNDFCLLNSELTWKLDHRSYSYSFTYVLNQQLLIICMFIV